MMAHNIVQMKNIDSSLNIERDEDLSPPCISPRLEESKIRRIKDEVDKVMKTSNSMIDMRKKLEEERSLYSNSVS